MYQLTSFTLARPCDAAPVDQPLDSPYFEIVYYAGDLGLVGYKCSSADKTSCDTSGATLFLDAKPLGDDAYREQQALTTGNLIEGCAVDYYGTDIQKSSAGVTISYLQTRGSTTGQACGGDAIPDATLTQFRDFDCSSVAVREGTRL